MSHIRLVKDTDLLVDVDQVRDSAAGGTFLESATVTFQLFNELGGSITGPTSAANVAGSTTGHYQGTIPDTIGLSVGDIVGVELVIDGGPNLKSTERKDAPVLAYL